MPSRQEVAAALAARHGIDARHIDVNELKRSLHTLGSEMGEETRLREPGII